MGRFKLIDSPEKTWELPLKMDMNGNYLVIPKKRLYSGITEVNKRKNPNGYIYFIKSKGFDFYKLGVSSNPERRLRDIDSYTPFELEILSIHFLENVYDIEKSVSEKIEKFKVRKEWYQFDSGKAKQIMIHLHNLNVNQDERINRQ